MARQMYRCTDRVVGPSAKFESHNLYHNSKGFPGTRTMIEVTGW
jgi:hypothetical protein